jgi:prolyl-tRNA synthetase
MKDAYSFHLDADSLDQTYWEMYEVYSRIFERSALRFRSVAADPGAIGGNQSHEFHVLADSGEDAIVFSTESDYAANLELAEAPSAGVRPAPAAQMQTVDTPGQHTIEEVAASLGVDAAQCVKTLMVAGADGGIVALCLRGDHTLNAVKAEKLEQVASPLTFADDEQIIAAADCRPGSLGPVGLDIPVIADHAALALADFVCGANEDGKHCTGANWGRDCAEPVAADIRNLQEGDPSPDGRGLARIARGIEVGHIFQLGDKYSSAMKATVLDENGREVVMTMGCYGIGVSRVVAAAIEQNHDDQGIRWPLALAPFQVAVLGMNQKKSQRVREACAALYVELVAVGIEVIWDDRDVRPGVMFADMELIGIPHRVVIGEKNMDKGLVEYKARSGGDSRDIERGAIVDFLQEQLGFTD